MDRNSIPVAYDLFPGNESEKVHMRPIINRVKREFSHMRIIIVADRGLNTSDNIYYLSGDNRGENNQRDGDGYVYGQSIRGASEEFKKWAIGNNGYKTTHLSDEEGNDIKFTHKSRIYPKELLVNVSSKNGKQKKKTVTIDQKQMVYYSAKYAKKQRFDRNIMVERAKDLIEHPKRYDKITAAGSAAYVNNLSFNKNTGEVAEDKILSLNTKKIEAESKYDGYYSIVTSELEMSDCEMQEIYRGLSKIEDTFKLSKSELEARPAFVWTNEHIDGHFTTCFTALVLIRILETKLNNRFSTSNVLKFIRKVS